MPSQKETRFRGLDGLRGLAALAVLGHHLLIQDPWRVRALSHDIEGLSRLNQALTYTPLHIAWAGSEAVMVFFVLSSFVLTHAMLSRVVAWTDYYPRRVLRLYLPTIASLLVALPLAYSFRPTSPDPDMSFIYNTTAGSGTWSHFVYDATLWHQHATFLNGVVWSLHWEVVFSLALPAYLLLTRIKSRPAALAVAVALVALSGYGVHVESGNLAYLPVFGVGVLAASHREPLAALTQRWSPALAVTGVLLMTAPFMYAGARTQPDDAIAFAVVIVGAALLVLAFLGGAVGSWSARTAVVQWLGRRSFSLYLTHGPIVLTVAYLLGGPASLWPLALMAIPLSLVVAELFGRLIEEPAHRASKVVGAWAHRRVSAAR